MDDTVRHSHRQATHIHKAHVGNVGAGTGLKHLAGLGACDLKPGAFVRDVFDRDAGGGVLLKPAHVICLCTIRCCELEFVL